jgi:hypothetical protein
VGGRHARLSELITTIARQCPTAAHTAAMAVAAIDPRRQAWNIAQHVTSTGRFWTIRPLLQNRRSRSPRARRPRHAQSSTEVQICASQVLTGIDGNIGAERTARRAFSANLPITQCDALSRHSLRSTVGAMRCDRLCAQARCASGLARSRRSRCQSRVPLSASVSFVVSFAGIRESSLRTTGHGHPRSRTGTACHERWGAHLESVLGAIPREFESRILRYL